MNLTTTRHGVRHQQLDQLESRLVPALVINEVFINPPGIDDNREYVELRNTTGTQFSHPNIALVEVEGDPGAIGKIASDVHLGGMITGTNGMLIMGIGYTTLGSPWDSQIDPATGIADMPSTLGNDNLTLLLVEGYSGVIGQDLDLNDDGTLDITPWTNILDSVGWLDANVPGGKVYTPAVLTQSAGTPDAASRFANRPHPILASAWYNGDILALGGVPDLSLTYNPARASSNLPLNAMLTPGLPNLIGPPTAPIVTDVQINDGSVQRSMVTSITVHFDQVVTLPADSATAFQLTRRFDNMSIPVSAVVDQSLGHTAVTLTFSGPFVIGGSLPDGLYSLTIPANMVSNAYGLLDGNANTIAGDNFQLLGTTTNKFFRVFGDADGNGTVTASDFNAFRLAYGTIGASIFDFNGDNTVSASDFNEFRLRYGTSIVP